MARVVYFHVGLPKTGTTYLQTLMWGHREELLRQGVLLPGESARQHLWASGVVREDPRLDRRGPRAALAWDELVAEVNAWPATAVISHEFFAGASAEQARRAMDALVGAEVHVVVTAREAVGLVTARWQEYVKNGSTVALEDYPVGEEACPHDEWDWGTLDLADVLARWGASLPPERVHVLPLPGPGETRETLWTRFATLVGIDPATCDPTDSVQNESLGVVEVEMLRRVNAHLDEFSSAVDRGVWIRGYLAQGKLVPRHGEKFAPSEHRVKELRARGDRSADAVRERGYDVIGDLERLRSIQPPAGRRHPDTVTEAEMLDAAARTIAEMLFDVRRLTRQKRTLEGRVADAEAELALHRRTWRRRAVDRARRVWSRS